MNEGLAINDAYVIIAGSRGFNDFALLEKEVKALLFGYNSKQVTIISGTANGADKLGERFAEKYGCHLIRMPAEWDKYGKSAGYRRNAEMAKIATHCIAFWDRKSRGTKHMIDIAERENLRLKVVVY